MFGSAPHCSLRHMDDATTVTHVVESSDSLPSLAASYSVSVCALVICPCNDTAVRLTGRASSFVAGADGRSAPVERPPLQRPQRRPGACASVCERVRACASVCERVRAVVWSLSLALSPLNAPTHRIACRAVVDHPQASRAQQAVRCQCASALARSHDPPSPSACSACSPKVLDLPLRLLLLLLPPLLSLRASSCCRSCGAAAAGAAVRRRPRRSSTAARAPQARQLPQSLAPEASRPRTTPWRVPRPRCCCTQVRGAALQRPHYSDARSLSFSYALSRPLSHSLIGRLYVRLSVSLSVCRLLRNRHQD